MFRFFVGFLREKSQARSVLDSVSEEK